MVSAKKMPLSIRKYKRFIGKRVKFLPRTRSGKKMIARGAREGIIRNIIRPRRNLLFEIDYGTKGNPQISHFLRRSFKVIDNNKPK